MSDIAKPNFHAGKVIILAQGVRISQLEGELREAATEISALRARVAELEARATELPAWQKPGHQSRPKSTLAAEQSGETGHAGNATTQDSDALEAIRVELDLLRMAVDAGDPKAEIKLRVKDLIASLAALPNQGSSSNG